MPRIALLIEYDGTDFLGWQTQQQEPTLQSTLERAAGFVADTPIELVCSGRTDTGVHASAQVAHFDTLAEREPRSWMLGINSRLPPSVAVLGAFVVRADFHARYGARLRSYRYRIQNRPMRCALHARYATWERAPLDIGAMQLAAQSLVGEHDFTSFRTIACQAKSPRRLITAIRVVREGDFVLVDLEANAFLHHMCRNIVGSLLRVGRGERDVQWLAQVLEARDRRAAAPTAPAQGLCFLGPRYPREFGLPDALSVPEGFVDRWTKSPGAGE